MTLYDTINDEIKRAMLAKDRIRLETLRGIKKEMLEAKTAKGAPAELTEEAIIAILQRMIKQRKDSAEIYTSSGRDELAENEVEQLNVIREFLPKQLSEEELELEITKVITETGATSMKEMGKVMGIATKTLAGKAEGRAISAMVKKLLS
ncbi:MAG: GatB/YqeY domain-containing protein [Bacteroidales bacterium]|nr:GatB/YqeY domain-containing protein [Bacteroidales bacterium]